MENKFQLSITRLGLDSSLWGTQSLHHLWLIKISRYQKVVELPSTIIQEALLLNRMHFHRLLMIIHWEKLKYLHTKRQYLYRTAIERYLIKFWVRNVMNKIAQSLCVRNLVFQENQKVNLIWVVIHLPRGCLSLNFTILSLSYKRALVQQFLLFLRMHLQLIPKGNFLRIDVKCYPGKTTMIFKYHHKKVWKLGLL